MEQIINLKLYLILKKHLEIIINIIKIILKQKKEILMIFLRNNLKYRHLSSIVKYYVVLKLNLKSLLVFHMKDMFQIQMIQVLFRVHSED